MNQQLFEGIVILMRAINYGSEGTVHQLYRANMRAEAEGYNITRPLHILIWLSLSMGILIISSLSGI